MERTITMMGMVALLALLTAIFLPMARPVMAEWNRFNAIFTCLGKDCEVVELNDQYLTGTDSACVAAGQLLLDRFKANPDLKRVVIANKGWVPSTYRIVDRFWAECLADIDPRQECENYDPGFEFDEPVEQLTGE
jgi:hypothetical protein